MYGSADMFGQPAYHMWIFSGNYGPALSYGGDMQIESLALTLTDMYMTDNDTLIFDLVNPYC